jgi:NADH:ubiquinone oxidoreductase subunit 4 (subunit M)
MQFVELQSWIPRFNVNYHLGVDGISMLFVMLNSFITVTVVLAGWQVIGNKVAQYNAGFLIMSGLLNGIFSALDGVLFYVFFEASLIPLYLIIGSLGWTQPRLCGVQVLPVHPVGFAALPDRPALPVRRVRRQLFDSRLAQDAARL